MTRIVFFGTPQEAVPALAVVADSFEVGLVVTQPDRPRGRSGTPAPPPVKKWAVEAGLEVAQPRSGAELGELVGEGFDVGVVVAYGRILRPEILAAPRTGILNLHFSLLPRWRGAAPVPRALMAGDLMTGVTIILLDEGLDTGPVLTAQGVDIGAEENAGELASRLATAGAVLLGRSITPYLNRDLVPIPQSDEGVTYAGKIEASDRPLDDDVDPAAFLGRVRGLAPVPGATLSIDGVRHKVLRAIPDGPAPGHGTWVTRDGWPVVGVGDAGIRLLSLQAPGRRPQSGDQWVRGVHRRSGVVG
jgi:methionyl-tRNA formyltransferase